MKNTYAIITIFFSLLVHAAMANVRLPAVIGNNMVLQQKSIVKLWGWADPNEKIITAILHANIWSAY